MVITSKDNPKVKYLTSLHKGRISRSEGVVFIEGLRLCRDAVLSGVDVITAVFSESFTDTEGVFEPLSCEKITLTDSLFEKVASTVHPQGVALVVKRPSWEQGIPYRGDGKDIYAVLEDIQDPGNLGTIVRTADAFDLTAVLISENTTDPFGEKAMRSSMGSCWHVPIIRMPMEEIISFLKDKDILRLAMHLKGDSLASSDLSLPCAFFIGNEGNGLTEKSAMACNKLIKIDMPGKAESLNAAASSAIIGYVLATKRG